MKLLTALSSLFAGVALLASVSTVFAQAPGTPIPAWLIGTWKGHQTVGPHVKNPSTTTFREDGTWVLEVVLTVDSRTGFAEGRWTVEGDTIVLTGQYTKGFSGNLKYNLSRAAEKQLKGTGIGAAGAYFNVDIEKQ